MRQALFDYLSTQTGALTFENIFLNFLVALLLGTLIFTSYRFSFSGAVYSARFNVSLVMLTLITTLVMGVIGNNIALSLGMVGALSIVRFRTAVKDPRDTAYIFWCIAVGICCGVSEYLIAAVGTVVLFIFLLVFGAVRHNDRFLLVIRSSKGQDQEIEKQVSIFFDNKAKIRVMNTSADNVEYIYELTEKLVNDGREKHGKPITEVLHAIEGVHIVNLVSQNDEINR